MMSQTKGKQAVASDDLGDEIEEFERQNMALNEIHQQTEHENEAHHKEMDAAALKLQCATRGFLSKKELAGRQAKQVAEVTKQLRDQLDARKKKRAMEIRAKARDEAARMLSPQNQAARNVAELKKTAELKEVLLKDRQEKSAGAVLIQSIVRGHQGRQFALYQTQRNEHFMQQAAAVSIQSAVRGWQSREEVTLIRGKIAEDERAEYRALQEYVESTHAVVGEISSFFDQFKPEDSALDQFGAQRYFDQSNSGIVARDKWGRRVPTKTFDEKTGRMICSNTDAPSGRLVRPVAFTPSSWGKSQASTAMHKTLMSKGSQAILNRNKQKSSPKLKSPKQADSFLQEGSWAPRYHETRY
jgi:hypothetical protein